jgi:formylglycine-generating enzyme required for sulfatase activity
MTRYFFLFYFCILLAARLAAQNHNGYFEPDAKSKKAPYGFLWTENQKLAVKQSEVSVDEYLYFLENISHDSLAGYVQKMVPPENCVLHPYVSAELIGGDDNGRKISWIDEEKMQKDLAAPPKEKRRHFSETVFDPYLRPITGISYEQAQEYAAWCTAKFNYLMKKKHPDCKIAVIFRLPSPSEFAEIEKKSIEACARKNPAECEKLVRQIKACRNEKGCALCNCLDKDTCKTNREATEMFGPETAYYVYAYNPGWTGLYNIQGNAAEMTTEKGTAKGGSYLQKAAECLPEAVQKYDKPEKWLGLRLLAEVTELDGKAVYFDNSGYLHWKKPD